MTYNFPAHAKTPLLLIGVIIAALLALPVQAAAPASGVEVRFTTPGTILPRRGHEVLTLESANVERLSASILHIPEADTLRVLAHPDAIPAEAVEIWHSQIDVRPNGVAPGPGQVVKSTLDPLQLVKPLQAGLYIARVHEVTTGTPRAQAVKLFMISNIGLEALAGADGLAVQARLLSEANPAAGIDVALVARNNREIARIRTDNDGVARFNQDQISSKGDDAPAAIYAYGADGEFTALAVAEPKLDPQSSSRAMIITDREAYKPGEEIRGLVLVRTENGAAAMGSPVYVQLENGDGNVAEFHTATAGDSSGFPIDFHAPLVGNWTIRAYHNIDNHPVLLGKTALTVNNGDNAIQSSPLAAPSSDKTGSIIIAPGRRSFQPGETANVSVQPPQDSFVTVALVDSSVHTIVRQKIGKDGAVVQLPVPNDASGGMYVVATAFTAPVEAHDNVAAIALRRSFGLQWIDIDQGAKRMSVRIDTPERAEIGGKLPVAITLQDLGDKTGKIQLIGSDIAAATSFDPLAFFYGQRPLSVEIFDTYDSIIGATEASVPDLLGGNGAAKTSGAALLWSPPVTTSKDGKADFSEIFPAMPGKDPRLKLSVIAWSDDRLGYAEASTIGVDPKQLGKKFSRAATVPASIIHSRAALLKPGQSITLKPHEAIIASADPLIAVPAAYDNNKPLFATSDMPQFRDYMQRLLNPMADPVLLYDAVLSLALPGQALDLPHVTDARMLDAVQSLLTKPGLSEDETLLAHYVLLKSGRETPLEVAAWLNGRSAFASLPAKATRLALATESALFKIDLAPLAAAIDDPAVKSDPDDRAITLCLLAEAGQPWPVKLAHSVAADSAKPTVSSDLAQRVAQGAHLGFGAAILKFAGIDQTGNAIVAQAMPIKVENADTRILHALVIGGLPQ